MYGVVASLMTTRESQFQPPKALIQLEAKILRTGGVLFDNNHEVKVLCPTVGRSLVTIV